MNIAFAEQKAKPLDLPLDEDSELGSSKKPRKSLLKMDTKQKCLGIKGINSEMPRYVSCET